MDTRLSVILRMVWGKKKYLQAVYQATLIILRDRATGIGVGSYVRSPLFTPSVTQSEV